jgi:hypothetical protein
MRRNRFVLVLLAMLLAMALPDAARAQMGGAGMQLPKSLGSTALPTGNLAASPARDEDPGIAVSETYVGWIDSAVPRSAAGLRFDHMFNNRQPMRAEYYHPRGGPGANTGFPFVETRIDYQELTSFAEYGLTPWLSAFIEAPYRWLNPEINRNQSGAGDMRYGMKICTWSSDNCIATILFRVYQPSARRDTLGTGHWSIEPGLLAAYRVNNMIHLEGEFRYWVPLGSSDFAGNILRYGAGVSYGHKKNGFWFIPVVEGIGWTVLSGKSIVASSPTEFIIEDAHATTIVNAYAGLRCGYGHKVDFYLGYGRSLTGDVWQRESFRFEARFTY